MSLKKVWKKMFPPRVGPGRPGFDVLPRNALRDADAVITANEVTDLHGTGVILRRILCVPYHPGDLVSALVLKELFDVLLCTYVMDDNNIFRQGINDELFREVLAKSDLRLAISPELRDAYEKKYCLKFWILPPIVQPTALQTTPAEPNSRLDAEDGVGALVGSLWSTRWLEQLRQTLKAAGLKVHWFGNAKAPWLEVSPEELRADGIIDCGFLPEAELTERLKAYLYALVPSGTLDTQDDRPEIARLSLPTRLPYLLAAANLPTLVLGSPQTAAARFVNRFEFGQVIPYEPEQLKRAVAEICRPEQQRTLRSRAAKQSRLFSAEGLDDWLWRSLAAGQPCDDRFERVFRRADTEVVPYLDPPAPRGLLHDLALVYLALRRLKDQGFAPDFVLDVGSSTGVWSDAAKRVFPNARFILVDPLHHQYARMNDWYFRQHPDFEPVAAAVSDRPGEAELSVSEDLYGSSLLHPADFRAYGTLRVPVRTLDDIVREKALKGHGLLKIDVQFAEHLVLAGAKKILPRVDALLVELSLLRYAPQAMIFEEMWELIRNLGFRYYEDTGGWRSPTDGTTLQKDVLFVRQHLFPYRAGRVARAPASNGNGSTEEAGTPRKPTPDLATVH